MRRPVGSGTLGRDTSLPPIGMEVSWPSVPLSRHSAHGFQGAAQSYPGMGSMPMGGMQGRAAPKLKTVDASSRVKSITYCRDTFRVTTEDGKSREFWERNLRFKTDSSEEGPEKDAPAILAGGMLGDRASVVFASPDGISRFIKPQC